MTTTIAVAGKGGTGKTTLAGLIVRSLVERGAGPVLAIDADPSSNLNAVLGMGLERTVGDIREETVEQAKAGKLDPGVAKADLLDYEINACLEEGEPQTWVRWGEAYYYMGLVLLRDGKRQEAIEAFKWAEQTVDEGEPELEQARAELSKLGQ